MQSMSTGSVRVRPGTGVQEGRGAKAPSLSGSSDDWPKKKLRHVCAHRSSLQAPPYFSVLDLWAGPMKPRSVLCAKNADWRKRSIFWVLSKQATISLLHVTVVCSRLTVVPTSSWKVWRWHSGRGEPCCGIPEMAPEGQGARLCEPDDVEGFCAAIEGLASDPEGYLH